MKAALPPTTFSPPKTSTDPNAAFEEGLRLLSTDKRTKAVGCFLAGFLYGMFEHRWPVNGDTRAIVLIGFLGAFTTFSAFIFESGEFFRTAEWVRAVGNILLQNSLGFTALFGGLAASRVI